MTRVEFLGLDVDATSEPSKPMPYDAFVEHLCKRIAAALDLAPELVDATWERQPAIDPRVAEEDAP